MIRPNINALFDIFTPYSGLHAVALQCPSALEPARRPAREPERTGMCGLTPCKHTANPPECGLLRNIAGSGYVKADTPRSVASFLAFGAT
jgi:hypothetical protein